MNKYYVYEWLRTDGTPYYIGKGTGFRAYEKRRPYKPLDKNRIKMVKENLNEQDALDLEIKLIKKYGRKDLGTGILRNKTDGGDGLQNISEETRKLISKNQTGRTPWNKGLTKDTDMRVKSMAESRSKVRYSEETLKKFRVPKSKEGRENMRISALKRRERERQECQY